MHEERTTERVVGKESVEVGTKDVAGIAQRAVAFADCDAAARDDLERATRLADLCAPDVDLVGLQHLPDRGREWPGGRVHSAPDAHGRLLAGMPGLGT